MNIKISDMEKLAATELFEKISARTPKGIMDIMRTMGRINAPALRSAGAGAGMGAIGGGVMGFLDPATNMSMFGQQSNPGFSGRMSSAIGGAIGGGMLGGMMGAAPGLYKNMGRSMQALSGGAMRKAAPPAWKVTADKIRAEAGTKAKAEADAAAKATAEANRKQIPAPPVKEDVAATNAANTNANMSGADVEAQRQQAIRAQQAADAQAAASAQYNAQTMGQPTNIPDRPWLRRVSDKFMSAARATGQGASNMWNRMNSMDRSFQWALHNPTEFKDYMRGNFGDRFF